MDIITFELIGKSVCIASFATVVFRLLWWCFDRLPIKIANTLDGNRAFIEYLCQRKKFKIYLKEKKGKAIN